MGLAGVTKGEGHPEKGGPLVPKEGGVSHEVRVTRSLIYSAKVWRDARAGTWNITVGLEGDISGPVELSDGEIHRRADQVNYFVIQKYRELEELLAKLSKEES